MKITIEFDSTDNILARHGLNEGGAVQQFIDSEVIRLSEPYVPFLNGGLRESANLATVIGSGKVVYDTPYAKRQYYTNRGKGKEGVSNGKLGGKRGQRWVERMMAERGEELGSGAAKIAGGRYER